MRVYFFVILNILIISVIIPVVILATAYRASCSYQRGESNRQTLGWTNQTSEPQYLLDLPIWFFSNPKWRPTYPQVHRGKITYKSATHLQEPG
jgi:hypothetical protein